MTVKYRGLAAKRVLHQVSPLLLCLWFASHAAAAPQIPALVWEERSDWVNLKTDVTPAAVGDGKADDTVAIQKALDGVKDGMVLYLPPGVYRITAPLSLRNSSGARWIGGLMIGSGRDTRIVWDGPTGGTMLVLNGIAYSKFIGFEFDGRGRAAVGFHYEATQGFQTEVTHRHLAFRGFSDSAVLERHPNSGQALAETMFENCLFEDCGRGVAFLQFNDYDFTFDGCEFRRCGVALDCARGNFYVRNCHFENSAEVDIRDWSEHCSSIRRSTSTGSKAFVQRKSTVASLTIQDCHVDGWKSADGAIQLSRPPLLIFDCAFSNPPLDALGRATAPIRAHSDGQRLLVSNNRVANPSDLVQPANKPLVLTVPNGKRQGVIKASTQSFLRDTAQIPKRVFDAKRDFGAKGDGATDDSAAIQKTIDAAAAASADSIAFLPSGVYTINATLKISGKNFSFGGNGWSTKLVWRGAEGGTMIEIRDPVHVTLGSIMIGSHDGGEMKNEIDIHQFGSAAPSHMTYDGVYAYGMYQKQPLRKGVRFTNLKNHDVVRMPHVQGNLRFVNSSAATVLASNTYEGSVIVEGKEGTRDGLIGFQTRLATVVSYGLYLHNSHNIVMSDFYVEQADNGYMFTGDANDPPGRATITGAKFHSFASDDPQKNNVVDIRNYHGDLFIGPYQFYQEPKLMRMKQQGANPVAFFLLASSWYGAKPDFQLGPAAKLFIVGNEFYGSGPDGEPVTDKSLFGEVPSEVALAKVSDALDDLRRLGEVDAELR